MNNVGSAPPRPGGFASIADADWTRTFELNALAAVRVTRELLDAIAEGARSSTSSARTRSSQTRW